MVTVHFFLGMGFPVDMAGDESGAATGRDPGGGSDRGTTEAPRSGTRTRARIDGATDAAGRARGVAKDADAGGIGARVVSRRPRFRASEKELYLTEPVARTRARVARDARYTPYLP